MTPLYKLSIAAFLFVGYALTHPIVAQTTIDWQKSIGTPNLDAALKIFNDENGNFVIMGTETHVDITGSLRTYLMVSKIDPDGNEIWKKYHDVAFQTNTIAFSYYFGDHFYTEVNGQKIINVVADLSGTTLLYKLDDNTGGYHSFENLASPDLTLSRDDIMITASTTCAVQEACYGPDSLFLLRINPVPDSNWNVIEWTFGIKQNIRTAAIQGHYDFDVNDIATDEQGNVYALVQIEAWKFQFCTDCNDAFIDAHNMIFKWNAEGELQGYKRLNITTAEVSHTELLSVANGNIMVRVNDINQEGTAILTTIFRMDYELVVKDQFDLDRYYNHLVVDSDLSLYAVTNVYDPNDPNIKGASDIIVTKFNSEGEFQWNSYYGGTSFDFPRGFVLTGENGIVFFANTESNDFDVAENHGYQDMWLVKLTETTTGVDDNYSATTTIYPNPATDFIHVSSTNKVESIRILDSTGRLIRTVTGDQNPISLYGLHQGSYLLEIIDEMKVRSLYKLFVVNP